MTIQSTLFEAIAEGEMKIHQKENNKDSETFLNENRKRLTRQCEKVLNILKSGIPLTTQNAPLHGILSLPRRLKDLRDYNGIVVKERWLTDEKGKRIQKEWYL